jgi:multiple RNA-binding domain-containing protein 1
MRKGSKSRKFGFVGFRTESEAIDAKKFFNNTFMDTSKLQIEYAK